MLTTLAQIAQTLGFALFLGSIATFVLAGLQAGAPGAAAFLQARRLVVAGTWRLTVPGSVLILIGGLSVADAVWIPYTLGAAIVVLVGLCIVAPAAGRSLAAAESLARGEAGARVAAIIAAKRVEDRAGAANLLLALVLLVVAAL